MRGAHRPPRTAGRHRANQADPPLEHLRQYFHLPVEEASERLGLNKSKLKRLCREYGISRWPQRKLQSLAALREYVQRNSRIPVDELQGLLARLEQQVAVVLEDPDRPLEREFEDMRKNVYKVRYQKRKQQKLVGGGSAWVGEAEGGGDEDDEEEDDEDDDEEEGEGEVTDSKNEQAEGGRSRPRAGARRAGAGGSGSGAAQGTLAAAPRRGPLDSAAGSAGGSPGLGSDGGADGAETVPGFGMDPRLPHEERREQLGLQQLPPLPLPAGQQHPHPSGLAGRLPPLPQVQPPLQPLQQQQRRQRRRRRAQQAVEEGSSDVAKSGSDDGGRGESRAGGGSGRGAGGLGEAGSAAAGPPLPLRLAPGAPTALLGRMAGRPSSYSSTRTSSRGESGEGAAGGEGASSRRQHVPLERRGSTGSAHGQLPVATAATATGVGAFSREPTGGAYSAFARASATAAAIVASTGGSEGAVPVSYGPLRHRTAGVFLGPRGSLGAPTASQGPGALFAQHSDPVRGSSQAAPLVRPGLQQLGPPQIAQTGRLSAGSGLAALRHQTAQAPGMSGGAMVAEAAASWGVTASQHPWDPPPLVLAPPRRSSGGGGAGGGGVLPGSAAPPAATQVPPQAVAGSREGSGGGGVVQGWGAGVVVQAGRSAAAGESERTVSLPPPPLEPVGSLDESSGGAAAGSGSWWEGRMVQQQLQKVRLGQDPDLDQDRDQDLEQQDPQPLLLGPPPAPPVQGPNQDMYVQDPGGCHEQQPQSQHPQPLPLPGPPLQQRPSSESVGLAAGAWYFGGDPTGPPGRLQQQQQQQQQGPPALAQQHPQPQLGPSGAASHDLPTAASFPPHHHPQLHHPPPPPYPYGTRSSEYPRRIGSDAPLSLLGGPSLLAFPRPQPQQMRLLPPPTATPQQQQRQVTDEDVHLRPLPQQRLAGYGPSQSEASCRPLATSATPPSAAAAAATAFQTPQHPGGVWTRPPNAGASSGGVGECGGATTGRGASGPLPVPALPGVPPAGPMVAPSGLRGGPGDAAGGEAATAAVAWPNSGGASSSLGGFPVSPRYAWAPTVGPRPSSSDWASHRDPQQPQPQPLSLHPPYMRRRYLHPQQMQTRQPMSPQHSLQAQPASLHAQPQQPVGFQPQVQQQQQSWQQLQPSPAPPISLQGGLASPASQHQQQAAHQPLPQHPLYYQPLQQPVFRQPRDPLAPKSSQGEKAAQVAATPVAAASGAFRPGTITAAPSASDTTRQYASARHAAPTAPTPSVSGFGAVLRESETSSVPGQAVSRIVSTGIPTGPIGQSIPRAATTPSRVVGSPPPYGYSHGSYGPYGWVGGAEVVQGPALPRPAGPTGYPTGPSVADEVVPRIAPSSLPYSRSDARNPTVRGHPHSGGSGMPYTPQTPYGIMQPALQRQPPQETFDWPRQQPQQQLPSYTPGRNLPQLTPELLPAPSLDRFRSVVHEAGQSDWQEDVALPGSRIAIGDGGSAFSFQMGVSAAGGGGPGPAYMRSMYSPSYGATWPGSRLPYDSPSATQRTVPQREHSNLGGSEGQHQRPPPPPRLTPRQSSIAALASVSQQQPWLPLPPAFGIQDASPTLHPSSSPFEPTGGGAGTGPAATAAAAWSPDAAHRLLTTSGSGTAVAAEVATSRGGDIRAGDDGSSGPSGAGHLSSAPGFREPAGPPEMATRAQVLGPDLGAPPDARGLGGGGGGSSGQGRSSGDIAAGAPELAMRVQSHSSSSNSVAMWGMAAERVLAMQSTMYGTHAACDISGVAVASGRGGGGGGGDISAAGSGTIEAGGPAFSMGPPAAVAAAAGISALARGPIGADTTPAHGSGGTPQLSGQGFRASEGRASVGTDAGGTGGGGGEDREAPDAAFLPPMSDLWAPQGSPQQAYPYDAVDLGFGAPSSLTPYQEERRQDAQPDSGHATDTTALPSAAAVGTGGRTLTPTQVHRQQTPQRQAEAIAVGSGSEAGAAGLFANEPCASPIPMQYDLIDLYDTWCGSPPVLLTPSGATAAAPAAVNVGAGASSVVSLATNASTTVATEPTSGAPASTAPGGPPLTLPLPAHMPMASDPASDGSGAPAPLGEPMAPVRHDRT